MKTTLLFTIAALTGCTQPWGPPGPGGAPIFQPPSAGSFAPVTMMPTPMMPSTMIQPVQPIQIGPMPSTMPTYTPIQQPRAAIQPFSYGSNYGGYPSGSFNPWVNRAY